MFCASFVSAEPSTPPKNTHPTPKRTHTLHQSSHYLNLTSIAETHHAVRTHRIDGVPTKTPDQLVGELIASGVSKDDLYNAVVKQRVEIVLTAHPTQVNRRTLQYKYARIAALLHANDALASQPTAPPEERSAVIADLVREVTALWQTDELRRRKPTPVDEASGGLHIVEQSLWAAVPAHLRRLSAALRKHTGRELPMMRHPSPLGRGWGATAMATPPSPRLSRATSPAWRAGWRPTCTCGRWTCCGLSCP